ncbi:MAG: response regulator transcription factor [Verrucomicrobia bacterium]|nr:response regulator transcription factor [Verrucomicrobiota bacterium]
MAVTTSSRAPAPVVHVVDDDPSLRTAVTRLLRATGYDARPYASVADFLLAQSGDLHGCVLLDVRMPGGPSGLELQEALAKRGDTVPIVFLTGHGDIPTSVRAMKAGAVDFLTKPVERRSLLAAVRTALAREAQMQTTRERWRQARRGLGRLTPREREIFAGVIKGQLNKQIAADLGTAERTVKAHRARVMEKMGVRSVAELVHLAEALHAGGAWPMPSDASPDP